MQSRWRGGWRSRFLHSPSIFGPYYANDQRRNRLVARLGAGRGARGAGAGGAGASQPGVGAAERKIRPVDVLGGRDAHLAADSELVFRLWRACSCLRRRGHGALQYLQGGHNQLCQSVRRRVPRACARRVDGPPRASSRFPRGGLRSTRFSAPCFFCPLPALRL